MAHGPFGLGVVDTRKNKENCVLHIYVKFFMDIVHSEPENLMIYSFSLWCSLGNTQGNMWYLDYIVM